MKQAKRAALIAELVRQLREQGSWTGETHVQKTVFFLQELLEVPLDFRFSLYKYGPFSFDLRDQLTEMRSLGQLTLETQPAPYGPKLNTDDGAEQLKTRFPKTIERYRPEISFVVENVGTRGVGSLERLATALLVTVEGSDANTDERVAQLTAYKPHVSNAEAREAVEEVDALLEAARAIA